MIKTQEVLINYNLKNNFMKIGYIGLGKMGMNMVRRMLEKGQEVVAYDIDESARVEVESFGAESVSTIQDFKEKFPEKKIFWLMVPHTVVDSVLLELSLILSENDIVIDGGNSNFNDSMRRAKELEEKGIHFMDVGTSGGMESARTGSCVMIGGKREIFNSIEDLFKAVAAEKAYKYIGRSGAGHFVKMVHNGIEYGMMQAIGEGFELMKKSDFDLNLIEVADVYNHQSIIESRLVGWLKEGFEKYGEDLEEISGKVSHSGEGLWTVQTAEKMDVPVPIIKGALDFREQSQGNPSYTGQVVSVQRNMFGGHEVKKNN